MLYCDELLETDKESLFDLLLKAKHEPLNGEVVKDIISNFLHAEVDYKSALGDISIIGYTVSVFPFNVYTYRPIVCIIANRELLAVIGCGYNYQCTTNGPGCKVFHCSEPRELIKFIDHDTYGEIIDKCAGLEICEDATFATFLTKKVKSARS
jgi:hypothetical protein